MSLLDSLLGQVGGDNLKQLSNSIGADERETEKAVRSALPVLLGAVTKNARSEKGAAALNNALERDHDGGILGHLGGLFGGGADHGKASDGEGILRHMLGGKRGAVEEVVARDAGVDSGVVSKLLPKLAPMLMGALGQKKQQDGLDLGGLMGMLGKEADEVKQKAPQSSGLLGKLFDQDGDGDLDLGDAASLLGGFLKRK